MSRWLALALGFAACAAKTPDAAPIPVPTTTAPSSPAIASSPPAPPQATLDELAARQVRVAPGMRELLRGETATAAPLPKVARDTCVRVLFATGHPAAVSLVAKDGTTLASTRSTTEGVLDTEGPVCFRAAAEPSVVVAEDAGVVRFVLWGSP